MSPFFSQFANHSSIGVQLSSVVSIVGGIGSEYIANLSCISCHVKLVIIGRSVVAESTATAAAASLGSITTVGSIALYEDSTIVGCTDDASRPISEITATTTTAVPLLPGVNIRTSTNAGSELCGSAKLVATFHSGLLSGHATCSHRHMHEWEEPATLSMTLPLAPVTSTATVFSTVSGTPSSSPRKSRSPSILSWSLTPSSQQPPENVEPMSSSTTLVGSLSPSATKRIATTSVSWTEVRTTPPSPQTPSSPPPTRIPRKVTVRVKPNMGLSEEERVATVGVGVSAASFVSPTTATGIGKLGALSQLVECSLLDDDFTPDPVEHPLSPAIGSTKYNRLAGAALCSTLIVVVPTLVASLLSRQRNPSSLSTPHHRYTVNVVKILGVVHVATFGYFLPNVMNVVATIFMHCTGFVERAAACVSIVCCTAIFILRCLTVHVFLYDSVEVSRRTKNNINATSENDDGKSSSEDTSNLSIISDESPSAESSSSESDEEDEEESSSTSGRQHGSSLQRALSNGRLTSWSNLRPRVAFPFFIDLYGSFFDGAEPRRLKMESRNAQTKSCGLGLAQSERARRSYVFVDVGVTSCGTFLSGLRPTADRGCLYLAWTLGFLGLTHLLYLSILRPVRTRLETISMITMAISNVVSAAACIAALTQDDQPTTRWTDIVNFCLTFQLLHYFAASLIQGVWALVRAERRKAVLLMKHSKNEDHSGIVSSDDTTAVGGNHDDHDDYDEQPPPLLVLYSSDEDEEDVFTQGHQRPLLLRPSASGGRVEVEMKNHVVEAKPTLIGNGHVSNPLR